MALDPPKISTIPLEYGHSRYPRKTERLHIVWQLSLGASLWFAGVALFFAVIVHALDKGLESTTRQTAPTGFNPAVLVFGFIAAISIGVGLLLLRRQPRRFMLIGFLIGFGLGSIIEGTCFAR